MTGPEYRAIIAALRFVDLGHAAKWLGVTRRGEQLWAIHGPPYSVAKLLRLMVALKLDWYQADARIAKSKRRDPCQQEPQNKPSPPPARQRRRRRLAADP